MTSKLSDAQKKVANDFEGSSMVIACPGAGKTTVILKRVMNMIKEGTVGVDGKRILIVTFTKAAADDLQQRLYNELTFWEYYRLCILDDPCINIMTLHSLCLKIIQNDWICEHIMIEDLIVSDSTQKDFFAKEIKKRYHLSDEDVGKKAIEMISQISKARNLQKSLSDMDEETREIYKVYRAYKLGWLRKTLSIDKAHKMDWDDLLVKAYALLKKDSQGEQYWGYKYHYIMVDEFQDVNKMQLDILFELALSKNICVVGDDDQSIYEFRGSNPTVFEDFKKQYVDCKEYHLDVNYRSMPDIIGTAAKLIAHNTKRIHKKFKAYQKQGGTAGIIRCDCTPEEMLGKIADRVGMLKSIHDIFYKKTAVLFRNNRQALPVIITFLLRGIPFKFLGNMPSVYDEVFCRDIKIYYELTQELDLDKLLAVLNHPNRYLDSSVFYACTPCRESFIDALRMCGKYTEKGLNAQIRAVESLFGMIERLKGLPPALFVKEICNAKYEKWLCKQSGGSCDNYPMLKYYVELQAMKHMDMTSWIATWKDFSTDVQEGGENKDAVVMSTFHSSKGLEWDEVHVIDVNEGIAPMDSAKTDAELEEERRLFYVAMTRAKKRVSFYVTGEPSPYLAEMGLSGDEEKEDVG